MGSREGTASDTRITYEEETGQWEASLFVDNVLDKTYIRSSDMDARRTGYGGNWPQRLSRYIQDILVQSLLITSTDRDLGPQKSAPWCAFFLEMLNLGLSCLPISSVDCSRDRTGRYRGLIPSVNDKFAASLGSADNRFFVAGYSLGY